MYLPQNVGLMRSSRNMRYEQPLQAKSKDGGLVNKLTGLKEEPKCIYVKIGLSEQGKVSCT